MADSFLHSTTCHTKAFYPIEKFQSQVLPEKSLTENFHMHYIGVRDGKRKMEKKETININPQYFLLHNILGQPPGVYKV